MDKGSGASKPWMKFYPQDWRADERLRLCSLSARGLWVEMMAIMHRAEPYGHLLIGGISPTNAQLATQVGADIAVVEAAYAELESLSVFSKDDNGVIYSRRMVRDWQKAEIARTNGKSGGNPALKNRSSDKGSDNPPLKGGLKLEVERGVKAQIPEARGQSSVPDGTGAEAPIVDPIKVMFDVGVALLTSTGTPARQARGLIAKWQKLRGDSWTREAIAAAAGKTEPVSWIEARARSGAASESDAADVRRATIDRYRNMDMPGPPPGVLEKANG